MRTSSPEPAVHSPLGLEEATGASGPGVLRDLRTRHILLVALIGYAVRLLLIVAHPAVFGGDTLLRLANPDRLVLAHWLPLPQALIWLLDPLAGGPFVIRNAMAVVGALAGVAFYLLAARVVTRRTAFIGTLFFITNPMILTHSTVPYQEIVQILGLLGAFSGASAGRWGVSAALLAIACLARYESWLACPVLALLYLRHHGWSGRRVMAAAALFGAVPIMWLLAQQGITPHGTVAVQTSFGVERLARWRFLGYVTILQSALVPLVLAPFGARIAWRRGWLRDPGVIALVIFVALFLAAIPFSSHGTDPDPERFVAAREAHMLLVAVVLFATFALSGMHDPRRAVLVGFLGGFIGLWTSDYAMRRATGEDGLHLSLSVAALLDRSTGPDERVAVLAAPVSAQGFLASLERRRGPDGRHAGIAVLRSMDNRPSGYLRILVHSRLTKAQLLNYSNITYRGPAGLDTVVERPVPRIPPDWIVAWSDFQPTSEGEEWLASLTTGVTPYAVLEGDNLSVRIYRFRRGVALGRTERLASPR